MATYQYLLSSGSNTTDGVSYTWAGLLTSTIENKTATSFDIENSDGSFTEVDGSGFTYNTNFVTGGTITDATHTRIVLSHPIHIEQITGLNLDASGFGEILFTSSNDAFGILLSGNDTILASYLPGTTQYYDGEAGSNTLELSAFGAIGNTFTFGTLGGSEEGSTASNQGNSLSIINNIQIIDASAGDDEFYFALNDNSTLPTGITLNGGAGTNTILMTNDQSGEVAELDLTTDTLLSIQKLIFSGGGQESVFDFLATQFGGGGIAQALAVQNDNAGFGDRINISMSTATSFNLSGFTFTDPANTFVTLNGSASTANLTIIGCPDGMHDVLYGGSGNDVVTAFAGENVIGGTGFNTLIEGSAAVTVELGEDVSQIQEFVANSGANTISVGGVDTDFVYLYGGTGNDTMSSGSGGSYMFGEGGANTLTGGGGTNVFVGGGGGSNIMNGGTGNNVYYTTASDTIHGAGTYNTDVLLTTDVNLSLGSSDVQLVILNSGTNSVSMAGSTQFDYLYGGAGNDTLATGADGGYLIGEGGANALDGGGGTNVFIGGDGGSNVMNGGSGSNVYYIGPNDSVNGAGTFNTLIELDAGVTETLGGAGRTDIQEVLANAGTNVLDASAISTQIYLYGGANNDTLFGGTGNDFLYGGAGTNTFGFKPGWGIDTITDWTSGTNNQIDLTALASEGVHSMANLSISVANGSDVITSSVAGSNSITLYGFVGALTASNFKFA